MRAFFDKFGRQQPGRPRVRVLAFKSEKEYDPYRSGSFAAAYYVGTEKRDRQRANRQLSDVADTLVKTVEAQAGGHAP